MSYSMDERLPKNYLKSVMEEKAKMLRKYLRDIGDPLVFSTHIRHSMAALKFCSHEEEDSSNYISPSPIWEIYSNNCTSCGCS